MSLDSLCTTHTVKIERQSTTIDSSGGAVFTWNEIHDAVLVNIQPVKAKEKMLFAQRQIEYSNKIYSAVDLAVKKKDRITDLNSGRQYVVTGYADMAGQNRAFLIEAREIE